MDALRPVQLLVDEVRREAQRIHERKSREHVERLEDHVNELLAKPLPTYWRQDLVGYLAMSELDGYRLRPECVPVLEGWIEAWAKRLGRLSAERQAAGAATAQMAPGLAASPRSEANFQPTPVPASRRPTLAPSATTPSRPADKPSVLPPNWPKLTPAEIDRVEIAAGRRWWYPLVPVGENDSIWLRKFETSAQAARLALLTVYQELAELGRMAESLRGEDDAELEPLLAKQAAIQQAYDKYIRSLVTIEVIWKEYLERVVMIIGVHVIALKEKIDRLLPMRVEGLRSSFDAEFKSAFRASAAALNTARGRVERGYTVLVWVDRVITAAQFILPIVGGAKQVFLHEIKRGLSKAAAFKTALAYALPQAARAAAKAAAVGEIVPRVLEGFGVNEADSRAGLTILLSLTTLGSAIRQAAGRSAVKTPEPPKPSGQPQKSPSRVLSPFEAKRRAGIAFNKARAAAYPYNEIPVAKSGKGKPFALDSYDPVKGEIVSRKNVQLSEIQLNTAKIYIREVRNKYPPGSLIPRVPSAPKELAGSKLKGELILEVPVQWKKVPKAVLKEAENQNVRIRDTNGKIYYAD